MDRPLVGIAICIRRENKVLVHKRKGKHAPGTWAFPGGHMEMWETFEETALRELAEEAGNKIKVANVRFWTALNTRFLDEGKHYVLIMMIADWVSGEAELTEPDKCEGWGWYEWEWLPIPLMQGCQLLLDGNFNPIDY
jgi:8-oxo-dGTP diphosphatase